MLGIDSKSISDRLDRDVEKTLGGPQIPGDKIGNIQRFINNMVSHETVYSVKVNCVSKSSTKK